MGSSDRGKIRAKCRGAQTQQVKVNLEGAIHVNYGIFTQRRYEFMRAETPYPIVLALFFAVATEERCRSLRPATSEFDIRA